MWSGIEIGNTQITKTERKPIKTDLNGENAKTTNNTSGKHNVCVMTNSIYKTKKKQKESTNRFQTLTLMSAFFSIT